MIGKSFHLVDFINPGKDNNYNTPYQAMRG